MELFRKAIEGNVVELVKKIEVDGNGFWNELQDRNVLTEDQVEKCRKKV